MSSADVTQESQKHATPNGGVQSIVYYLDAQGKPAAKAVATKAEIHELDKRGEIIHRTYMEINRG